MSKLPVLETKTASGNIKANADILVVFQDSGKKPVLSPGDYRPVIERLQKSDAIVGKYCSLQYVRFAGKRGADDLVLAGAGAAAELTEERIRALGGNVYSKLKAERVRSASIQCDALLGASGLKTELSHMRMIRAFAEGLILGAYSFDKYKSKPPRAEGGNSEKNYEGPEQLLFVSSDKAIKAQLEKELEQVHAIGESVKVTRDWSNEPANYGTPEFYAQEAKKIGRQYGLKVKILTEREAAREKMNLFLAVGQGSEREGRVVVVEYTPSGAKNARKNAQKHPMKTLALVGKGVTFDTGGISIKPSARMEEMKHDMTGAATVMGALILASLWKVPNRVIGVMAFTENMPDGKAIVPGTIITARNGKTVEINNTDAEGRLILADALDYAQDFKPDAVVNIATLTGAVVVALGKYCCGVMGNDDGLIESVRRVGEMNGERIWQLPLFDEYFDDMKSDYADMKNVGNDPSGGTIRGGIFLKQFIRKGTRWAHLDIAATATSLTHLSYLPKKGASGTYVRTLAQLALEL